MIIGIDIGGSTTQGALAYDGKIGGFASIQASDETACAAGCLGKILSDNKIDIKDVRVVAATGGGSKRKLGKKILGIPVKKVSEIKAIGLGGLALTRKSKCFVVSLGTGTAMVSVRSKGKSIEHVGGTGVGGGMLKGLYDLILNKRKIENIELVARKGNLDNVDLRLKDIVGRGLGNLPADATAANFGKLSDDTKEEDVALGLMNVVGEVIGTLSVFAARNRGLEKDIVFVGKVTGNRVLMDRIGKVVRMFGGRSVTPKNAEFATAIGAAKSLI